MAVVTACVMPVAVANGSSLPQARQFSSRNKEWKWVALNLKRIALQAAAAGDLGTQMTLDAASSPKEEVLIQEQAQSGNRVDYNWETEWYPLYLKKEIPTDAPLGLTVYDHQVVLFYDGNGVLNCLEDCCPHRLAKLSEGQLMDGRLECLYHGWQFNGDGSCSKIPQLPSGAKIPRSACTRSYAVQESQDVVWVWMSDKQTADPKNIPWFEHYARPGFQDISTIHELPYDHSILLENLMDPAHIPISHDRTDMSAKREKAQALAFEVTERSPRGFAGKWGDHSSNDLASITRFEAPCCLRNDKATCDKNGKTQYFSALFLCRPSGQGKSMLIARFGSTASSLSALKWIPPWILHKTSNTVFEQDMGFLSSQNETLIRKGVATKELYLSLRSSDVWVTEYRKWLDLVGHGMPYYIGHGTHSPAKIPALLEAAPAGLVAATASSYPSKGAFGSVYARDPTNRYFRHVVHCKSCTKSLQSFKKLQKASVVGAALSAAIAIVLANTAWRVRFVCVGLSLLGASYACSLGIEALTSNFIRMHRK